MIENVEQAEQVIAEYNRIEAEQVARLRALYDFVRSRSGYRRVGFGNAKAWSNCWTIGKDIDHAHKLIVDGIGMPITGVDWGDG